MAVGDISPPELPEGSGMGPARRDRTGRYLNPPGSPEWEATGFEFLRYFAGQTLRRFARVEIPDGTRLVRNARW